MHGMAKSHFMTVNTEGTSRQSPIRTGEVELMEFFALRSACDDRDRAIRSANLLRAH